MGLLGRVAIWVGTYPGVALARRRKIQGFCLNFAEAETSVGFSLLGVEGGGLSGVGEVSTEDNSPKSSSRRSWRVALSWLAMGRGSTGSRGSGREGPSGTTSKFCSLRTRRVGAVGAEAG